MDMTTTRRALVGLLALVCVAIGHWGTVVIPPAPAPVPPIVVPVNPPVPIVIPPVDPPKPDPPKPDPIPVDPPKPPVPSTLAELVAQIDADITDAEAKKDGGVTALTQLVNQLEGVLSKHHTIPPKPPDPAPQPPTPPPAPVVATGFRVIFVSDEMASMTPAQTAVLYSPNAVTYLNSKCAKSADGSLPEWRRWHMTTEFGATTRESPTMVALWNTAKASLTKLPQVIIAVNGKWQVYTLPGSDADLMALLKQFGGA